VCIEFIAGSIGKKATNGKVGVTAQTDVHRED